MTTTEPTVDRLGEGRSAAVIIASTSAARGEAADTTGPILVDWLRGRGYDCPDPIVVRDGEPVGEALRELLLTPAEAARPRIVVTSGGTGLAPDDRTPEFTAELVGTVEFGDGGLAGAHIALQQPVHGVDLPQIRGDLLPDLLLRGGQLEAQPSCEALLQHALRAGELRSAALGDRLAPTQQRSLEHERLGVAEAGLGAVPVLLIRRTVHGLIGAGQIRVPVLPGDLERQRIRDGGPVHGGQAQLHGLSDPIARELGDGRVHRHGATSAVQGVGGIDVVVNNAGIVRDRMFVSATPEEWDATMHVHLRGHFCISRHAVNYWRAKQKDGRDPDARILNIFEGAAEIQAQVIARRLLG